MPAKDMCHDQVKHSLIKDGWTITDDPYVIKYEDAELYADLAAQKPFAAERQGQKIVVEIKSFIGKSLMYDFHSALEQYLVYRKLIQLTEPEYTVYLAVDHATYTGFFQRKSVQAVISENHLLLHSCKYPKGGNSTMDKIERYRDVIKKILTEYYEMAKNKVVEDREVEVSDRLAFDEARDEYIWFRFGWDDNKLIQYIIMYLRIKNGKIWVEEDATNLCVVDDLLLAEVPQSDIVLGFHPPSKRAFTEFATA